MWNSNTSTPAFTRALTLATAGWFSLLGAVLLGAMLWQGIASTHATDRQKILNSLDQSTQQLRILIEAAEMTADSTERIVRTMRPASGVRLRTALEMALGAFEQRPELSHLGIILPDTGEYGNLERSNDDNLRLWLYPGGKILNAVTRSYRLDDSGFVQQAAYTGRGYDLRIRPVYQAAMHAPNGAWIAAHPWIVHGDQYDPLWGFSYARAVRDEDGQVLAVIDVNFDITALQAYVNRLEARYDVYLDVIEFSTPPIRIAGDQVAREPHSLSDTWTPLLDTPEDVFADTMTINAERRWVAARTLALPGGSSWRIVASRAAPWLDVALRDLLWNVFGMMLLTATGLVLISRHMARRFGHPLEHMATHDEMTGLPNRVLLQQRIAQTIADPCEDAQPLFALLYLDLDRFRVINDGYGYLFGNLTLKVVGERLRNLARPQDLVAYISANRFLILLTQLHAANEAERLAQHILHGLNLPFTVKGCELHLSASIGVSLYPHDGQSADTLISSADMAMHRAKQLGRNTVQTFSYSLRQEIQTRIDTETRLRNAVAQQQLHLVYQPKVDLKSGRISGCEALLRWTNPDLGTVSPARFIPIAEDSGLIIPIGNWVLENACTQAKSWLDAGLTPVCIAVNLSARQFLRQDVVAWVATTLERTGLPAHCLELELTESLFPRDIEKAIETLDQLQNLGVRLSIDDFGTGYSNLSYLKRFRINTLKIDQGFVRNAIYTRQDAAIVRTVIHLAHTLGFTAIAEGVESIEHLQLLRAEACDEIQGYYFSPPVAAEAFTQMLREGTVLDT